MIKKVLYFCDGKRGCCTSPLCCKNVGHNEDEEEVCRRTSELEHATFYDEVPSDEVLNDETHFMKEKYGPNRILYLEI